MFNDLKINDEEVPEGQTVRFIRATDSWWDRPADTGTYLLALLIILVGVLAGIAWAG